MSRLSDISFWTKEYGLLPLHLKEITQDKYLMLNGNTGNFCLQLSIDEGVELYKQYSWSANNKNYVQIGAEEVKIINWLDTNPVTTFKTKDIESRLDKFYGYLLSKSYKTQSDIVPFVIQIFRQLRSETNEKQNPSEALNLLFKLLVRLEVDNFENLSNKFSGLNEVKLPDNFEQYVIKLKDGIRGITPNLDIILRHTSGALFQEAHKEVLYFDAQRNLWGELSGDHKTKVNPYSSVHYTPPYLARTIVEQVLKGVDMQSPTLKILDPSCGSSEFLIEVLKQLKDRGYNGELSVFGYDSSASAIETSKFLLNYEKYTQWDGKLNINLERVDDSLAKDWGTDADIILMNPPFVSWELLKNKESRARVREILDGLIKGKPNQAGAFFYKAVTSLNENGIIGCVLPSGIYTNDAFNGLRNKIMEQIELKLLARLGNYVFEDALTDISIFVGKKPTSNKLPQLIWARNNKGVAHDALRELRKINANNEQGKSAGDFDIYTPSTFPIIKEKWKIPSLKEEKFIKDLDRYVQDKRLTLSKNIFSITSGALLGAQNVFIVSKAYYDELDNEEKKLFRKAITSKSLHVGKVTSNEYVWYPYNEDGIIFTNQVELEGFQYYRDYLLPNKEVLEKRKKIIYWWQLSWPRNFQFINGPRLYSSRFGSSKSFGFDKKGDTVIIEGSAWLPKVKFEFDDYYFYLAVFSSSTFNEILSIYSKQLAGGKWYDLGAKYTSKIPIPDITLMDRGLKYYMKLVELGKKLSEGNSDAAYQIDEVVKVFYPVN